MDEIQQSRDKVKQVKQEVNAVHKRTTRELAQQITKSNYQFKKKAHEILFNLNSEIEESISTVKGEIAKVNANNELDKEAIRKAETLLDEGLKIIKK